MRQKFDPRDIPPFPTLQFERDLWQAGKALVAGLDEAGRGALAGPLCAAVVVLPSGVTNLEELLRGVRDSKQMSAREREKAAGAIRELAVDIAVGWCGPEEIDELGMGKAGKLVFQRALQGLSAAPEHLLIDYFALPGLTIGQTPLVKGDQRCLSIACASVIAKTTRDALMRGAALNHPGYGFEENKGYGTWQHRQALLALGPCPLHRKSFRLLGE